MHASCLFTDQCRGNANNRITNNNRSGTNRITNHALPSRPDVSKPVSTFETLRTLQGNYSGHGHCRATTQACAKQRAGRGWMLPQSAHSNTNDYSEHFNSTRAVAMASASQAHANARVAGTVRVHRPVPQHAPEASRETNLRNNISMIAA